MTCLPEEAERLLELMEPEEAAPVRRLLSYADDTAGGIMTSEPIILPPNSTVAEALARIRASQIPPALAAQVYVVRPPVRDARPAATSAWPTSSGCCASRRLRCVGGVIDTETDALAGPVVARRGDPPPGVLQPGRRPGARLQTGRLVGAVTVDDVLDHLLPQDWREHDFDPAVDRAARPDRESPRRGTR